jgi:hypothetical protein
MVRWVSITSQSLVNVAVWLLVAKPPPDLFYVEHEDGRRKTTFVPDKLQFIPSSFILIGV